VLGHGVLVRSIPLHKSSFAIIAIVGSVISSLLFARHALLFASFYSATNPFNHDSSLPASSRTKALVKVDFLE
jgi:hypothetical protein